VADHARTTSAGEPLVELAFDRECGVLLYLKTPEMYWGFESLVLNEPCEPGTFSWHGPTLERRRGTAVVTRDPDTGSFLAYWEINIRGRNAYALTAPDGMTFERAWKWGEQRAAKVVIRPGSEPEVSPG
jgi:hypothetical protein